MKYLLAILILSSLCSCSEDLNIKNSNTKSQKEIDNLKGDVYIVAENVYSVNIKGMKITTGDLLEEEFTHKITGYNRNGSYLNVTYLDKYGEKDISHAYFHDGDGELFMKEIRLANGSLKDRISIYYDHLNFFTKREVSLEGSRNIITFDKYNRDLTKKYFNKDSNLVKEVIYTYKNNFTNYLTRHSKNHKKNESDSIINELDSLGNVLMRKSTFNDKVRYIKYQYNDKNEIVHYWYLNSKSGEPWFIGEYKYKYDHKGNWINRIDYHYGRPKEITIRNIKYYDEIE